MTRLDFLHTKLLRLSQADSGAIAALKPPLAACVRASRELKAALKERDDDALFLPLFDRGALIRQNADRALSEGRTIAVEPCEIDSFFINDLASLPQDRVFIAHSDHILTARRDLKRLVVDFFARAEIAPFLSAYNTAPNTLFIRLSGIKARTLVQALKLDEIAITNGEGCSLDLFTPSFVAQSYGYSEDEAREAISLSWAEDIEERELLDALDKTLFRYRQIRRLN
ncbi:MAG: hypothetical protein LBO72_09465 [Helicobacteraceae bacterium]|jgi:hypothetical protein|nr:hypothetical protein [Helicobacteraceae bacterium]